jgi:predicted RNA-binding protein Jag
MRKAAENLETLPEVVARWCQALGLNVTAKFEPSGDEELFPNRIVLAGPDAQWLLPNKGQALDALQFLLHEVQGEREEGRLAYLDVQAFRLFRMTELKAMATMAALKTRELGSFTFNSLSPRERRWIHLVLGREPDLATASEGEGHFKTLKVTRK